MGLFLFCFLCDIILNNMKKILLIEDDPFLVDIYVTKLEKENFKVEAARSGKEAFGLMKKGKFDLVVLDILLPDMNGWDLLEKMREDRKNKKNRVIILSNKDPDKEKIEMDFGIEGYIIKVNYSPDEVVNEIKKVLI